MTEAEFNKLLQRYLAGHCTPQEQRLVEQWYRDLDQPGNQAIHPAEQAALLAAMWQRLDARTQLPVSTAKVTSRPTTFWRVASVQWAAAALVIFAVGLGVLLYGSFRGKPAPSPTVAAGTFWQRHYNATAQAHVLTLPDGSRITLSPRSRVRYAAAFAGPRREVYLSGEAFFEVSKNPARPFLVLTRQVVTTVLGTSFRVRAYAGSPTATVAVRTGRVAVQARAGAHLEATPDQPARAGLLLLPNQQAEYSPATKQLKKDLVAQPVVLAPQSFVFSDRPVAEVLTALEKAYGVPIDYDRTALAGTTVTLHLTNASLYGKLDVLCEALGASYEKADARIRFQLANQTMQ